MDWQYFLEILFSGLTRGSIYALIALGYTMVYGIIELINFAHGEIYMLGAFTAFIVAGILGSMGFSASAILVIAAFVAIIWCVATPWKKSLISLFADNPAWLLLFPLSVCPSFCKTMCSWRKRRNFYVSPSACPVLNFWMFLAEFCVLPIS